MIRDPYIIYSPMHLPDHFIDRYGRPLRLVDSDQSNELTWWHDRNSDNNLQQYRHRYGDLDLDPDMYRSIPIKLENSDYLTSYNDLSGCVSQQQLDKARQFQLLKHHLNPKVSNDNQSYRRMRLSGDYVDCYDQLGGVYAREKAEYERRLRKNMIGRSKVEEAHRSFLDQEISRPAGLKPFTRDRPTMRKNIANIDSTHPSSSRQWKIEPCGKILAGGRENAYNSSFPIDPFARRDVLESVLPSPINVVDITSALKNCLIDKQQDQSKSICLPRRGATNSPGDHESASNPPSSTEQFVKAKVELDGIEEQHASIIQPHFLEQISVTKDVLKLEASLTDLLIRLDGINTHSNAGDQAMKKLMISRIDWILQRVDVLKLMLKDQAAGAREGKKVENVVSTRNGDGGEVGCKKYTIKVLDRRNNQFKDEVTISDETGK